MEEKEQNLRAEFTDLDTQLQDPGIYSDPAYPKLAKRRNWLERVLALFDAKKQLASEREQASALASGNDELAELAQLELADLDEKIATNVAALAEALTPKDPNDEKDAIVEIRAAAGGDEASLFAADLYRMYSYYAQNQGWKIEVIDQSEGEKGGFKQITFEVKGKGAYSRLKYESGTHRVQRVPETEAQGRIHTSAVTVAVLAEVDEVEVNIRPEDLHEEFTRASGAGGQHVQQNSTAVRVVHIPSGLVVEVQDERSQLQNRLRAKQILASRLYDLEMEKQKAEQEGERRSQIGSGDRSEKIRTYNYPQNRVTDHRVNVSSYNLPAVMVGDIDMFIDEMATRETAEKLAEGGPDNSN